MRAVRGDLVIRRARIAGRPRPEPVDVRLSRGRIAEIAASVAPPPGGEELDASGGWLVPGLHDHHLHLRALAAARWSVAVGPPEVNGYAAFERALRRAGGDGSAGWVRAVGYHESVAGDLDRDVLDRLVADRPLRVQHRSGVLWVLNSAALELVGADTAPAPGVERDDAGRPTGRLWRMDGWLSSRTAALPDHELHSRLGELSRAAAALGVTGWTDATAGRTDEDTRLLASASAKGVIRQRLHLMARPGDPAGRGAISGSDLVSTGAVKVVLDDFDLPDLASLRGTFNDAHRSGRPVAVHCVTRTQLILTLAALEEAGEAVGGDRIEHGAVIPVESIPQLKRLGLTVVTQPNFVSERGDDYLRDVEPHDAPNLWRAASLVKAGVPLAAGTDAPFGRADPWDAIRAATSRRTPSGALLGGAERVDPQEALRWWLGTGADPASPRRLDAGEVADIAILRSRVAEAVAGDGPPDVVATVVAGAVVHG